MEIKFEINGTHIGIRDDGNIPPAHLCYESPTAHGHVSLYIDQEPLRSIHDDGPMVLDRRLSMQLKPEQAAALGNALVTASLYAK